MSALDEQYRHGGPMRECSEPYVRDLVDEMRRAAQDHRVLANALRDMGDDGDDDGDEYWMSHWHDADMARLKRQLWRERNA